MVKRKEIISPRVNRKVLPKEELYTIDLETGKTIKKLVWCDYHEEWEWIADFYLESQKKAKHSNDVRNMCIKAWDIVEGKTDFTKLQSLTRVKDKTTSASLIMFME